MKKYLLNTFLAGIFAAALLAMVIARALCPILVLPGFDVPNLVLISLIALLLDHWFVKDAKRCYICIPVFALLTFGLFPYAAGFVQPSEILGLAIKGCVTFTVTTWLFTSICERLSSGPAAKAAPFISAVGLCFAAQCLTGIIF